MVLGSKPVVSMMSKAKLRVSLLICLVLVAVPSVALAGAGGNFQETLSKGWVWAYLLAFGFGFLTSLTPCVYPMIPIVVGVFGARDESVGRRGAMILASSYVLGMATLYTVLGVVFAFLTRKAGTLLAEPAVILPVVGIYILLAASMFGAFELQLPQSLQNKLNMVGGRGVAGAFAMGLVGGLTAAPCTGPFIAGMLGWVASTRNVLAGGTLMFVYALGMGVLFFAIAVFTLSLPKSGRWMEAVKSIGGIALIGVALYFLRPVVPVLTRLVDTSTVFLVAAVAAAVIGVAIGAVHLSFKGSSAVTKLRKGVGVALVVAGGFGAVNWAVTANRHLPWRTDEAAAFAEAKEQGKGVMIDFSAKWCTPCLRLETTFAAPGVYERIVSGYVPLKYDVSKQTEEQTQAQKRFDAETLPAVVFLDADKNELHRLTHYVSADDFREALDAADQARAKVSRSR